MAGSVGLPVALLADEEDARAEVRVALPEPVAAVEVGLVDYAGSYHLIPLEVRQRLEEDPAAVHDPQAARDRVALERVERVGDAVAVLGLRGRDRRVVRDQAHEYRDLPRRRVGVGADEE